jgi:integrase
MSTLLKRSDSPFVSPLATQLVRFLAQKQAMGYRYRDEARMVRELDRFLAPRLPADDPVLTLEIAREFVARRGTESDSTRAHRLTIIREVSRFLRPEDPRTAIPGPRFLGIVRSRFVPRVLTREEGAHFLQACATFPCATSSSAPHSESCISRDYEPGKSCD